MADTDYRDSLLEVFKNLRNFVLLVEQAHWNVLGSNFGQLHKLFELIRDENYEDIDPLAEAIRSTFTTVCNSPKYLANSGVQFLENPRQTESKYLSAIHAANRVYAESLFAASSSADKADKIDLVELLGGMAKQAARNYYLIESQMGLTEQPE